MILAILCSAAAGGFALRAGLAKDEHDVVLLGVVLLACAAFLAGSAS